MATAKKRKTTAKKVAKLSRKRAKPTPPRKPAKPVKPTKPKTGPTRAGSVAGGGGRYFWMFAFYLEDDGVPVGWDASWGGTPRIPTPPHEVADPGAPDLVAIFTAGSPRFGDHKLFLISSPVFSSQDDAITYMRDDSQGMYLYENCTNCALFQMN